MRGTKVIGGEFRGRVLDSVPDSLFIRPILARIKKSLFDILQPRIPNSSFLDLFAGSGSVGLEAISRGAKKVIFVELNPRTRKRLESVLENWSDQNPDFFANKEWQVYCRDVRNGLDWLEAGFDIIFSGAPYVDMQKKQLLFVESLLERIHQDGILNPGGIFVAQHHKKESFRVLEPWRLSRQEKYGDSLLSFFSL